MKTSEREHVENMKRTMKHLEQGGLCNGDKKEILDMVLRDIADEFRLPEWLLVRVVETLCMASSIGRKKEREDYTLWKIRGGCSND